MTHFSAEVGVTDLIEIPASAKIQFAPLGNICGLRLEDGRLLRPWIVWEIEEADGTQRDLSHDDLLVLGFQPSLETSITIEIA